MTPSTTTAAQQAQASAIAATFAAGKAPARGVYDINSLIAGMVDRGAWKYWDTLNTAQGTQMLPNYNLFSVPIGQVDPVTNAQKTKLQTNMLLGGQFPPPRCLVLMQIGFLFSNMLLADIQAVLQNYYLEFWIDNKVFFEGRLEFFPSGYGVYGNSTNSGEGTWGLGWPSPNATVRYMQYAKYIAPQQLFSLKLITPNTPPTLATTANGGNGLSLVAFNDGVTDRSVQ